MDLAVNNEGRWGQELREYQHFPKLGPRTLNIDFPVHQQKLGFKEERAKEKVSLILTPSTPY